MNRLIKLSLSIIVSIFTSLAIAQTVDSESAKQNPEAVLSIVKEIINNEEFVLQNRPQNRLSSCILESPSAVWSITFCHFGEVQEGYVTDSSARQMSGTFTIKNTGTEINYNIDQPGLGDHDAFDAYKTIAQDPSFLIREQQSPSDRGFRNRRSASPYLYYLYLNIYPTDRFEDRIEVAFTEPMLPMLQNLAQVQKQLIETYGYRKQEPKQKPEAISSTIEGIINNEEFVLQSISRQRGTLSSLLCVYESPSALWSIKYCKTNGEGEGHWTTAMAGQFSIKNTDTKIGYYFQRMREGNIYGQIEQDPASLFLGEQSRWISMYVYANEQEISEVAFTEPMLPVLQNMARVQKQLIEQSTQ